MTALLDWFDLSEFPALVVLICLLRAIGVQMAANENRIRLWSRRFAAAALLLYAGVGIHTWGAATVTDFLIVVIRASLASGVCWGLAMVVLPPIACVAQFVRTKSPPVRPAPFRIEEPAVPVQLNATKEIDSAESRERERKAQINDARTETTALYEKHQEIHEALPPELFRSQLHARFTDGLKPEQAWMVAQEMINGMLPQISAAREKLRAEQEEQRKRTEQAAEEQRRLTESEERRGSFQKLADWYQKEQKAITDTLPEGQDREDALRELFQRYDQLMKEMYADMKP